ncbi:MAG: S8 family serine peptidase [Candidatus Muiribacteriota bacterium]
MKKTIILFTFFMISTLIFPDSIASKGEVSVLIVDSGTDFSHTELAPVADACELELNGNSGEDNNGSGFSDDVYGWNFVDNSSVQVDLSHTPPEYEDVLKFLFLMDMYSYFPDQLSEQDINFIITKFNDQDFLGWVNFVGGWAHGTHCAGIAGRGSDGIKMKGIKHITTSNPPREKIEELMWNIKLRNKEVFRGNQIDEEVLESLKNQFKDEGEAAKEAMHPRRDYIEFLNPRVINASYGTDNPNLLAGFRQALEGMGYADLDTSEVQSVVNLYVEHASIPPAQEMYSKVPNALIVIAAGNSAENNDGIIVSPNDMSIDNKLVVAATAFNAVLAPFSCYGVEKVDIAAPGTLIYDTYPNNQMGHMSGTSMSAPYVTNVAAEVIYIRPQLSAVETKKILMETVDKKDWLKDKVKSGGFVNRKRAEQVARWMNMGMNIENAITKANNEILPDKTDQDYELPRDADDPIYRKFVF